MVVLTFHTCKFSLGKKTEQYKMEMYEAQVLDNRDPWKCGRLYVYCPPLFQGKHKGWVHGSAPGTGFGSGFLSIPENKSLVLVTSVVDRHGKAKDYWLVGCWSTEAASYSTKDDENLTYGTNVPDHDQVYQYSLSPDRQIWKTQLGHSITLSEFVHNDTPPGGSTTLIQKNFIEVKSAGGKFLKLDDGVNNEDPGGEFDKIELSDEVGNRLVLQTGPGGELPANTVALQANTGLLVETDSGTLEISVGEEDKEILIQHYGKGPININAQNVNVKGNEVSIEAGDGEDDSIDATLSETFKTALTTLTPSINFLPGDIVVPITSHPKIKINGKPAITK